MPTIVRADAQTFPHHHLLDIERLTVADINLILDLAEHYAEQNRSARKKTPKLDARPSSIFFSSIHTYALLFEIAAKRLGPMS